MIKFNNFAYMSAIALIGAVGFTACSSDDDITNPNPTFDGETVKTQFAINIPHAGKSTTRMAQDVVQGQNSPIFRGMSDIQLIPIAVGSAQSEAGNPITENDKFLANAINLEAIAGYNKDENEDDYNGDLIDASNSKLYQDIDIPVNTNAFLFYGKATDKAVSGSLSVDQVNGALLPSYTTTGLTEGAKVSTIHFDLKGIMSVQSSDTQQKDALTGLLKAVGDAQGSAGGTFISQTGDDNPFTEYADALKKLKAGSANSIRLALQDLYNAMDASSPISEGSTYTGLKAAIQTAITGESNANFTTEGAYPNIKLTYASNFAGREYPSDIDLPDGAVQVSYNSADSKWSYVTTLSDPGTDNTGLNVASLDRYAYPASLYYWVNTSISTSNQSQASAYDGTNSWSQILEKYTDGKSVQSTTRSIAMDKEINYAVSRLDINAAFGQGAINAGDDEIVTLPSEGFKLTGVLIGGQKQVGWNFATNTSANEMTIYDADIKDLSTPANDVYVTRTSGLKTQTLVLETAGGTTSQAETVNFALEFENNSDDEFVGVDGIVPVGGKFYLIGKLNSETDTDKKGDSPILKVFEQDKYTTAKVTITSLKHAYNCIPDLRTPGLELGLSVDLTWIAGLVDDVEIN